MGWRDNLQTASFKGFPFLVGRIRENRGRRLAKHALINGGVSVQDLGISSRDFVVEGYFVQRSADDDPYLTFVDFQRRAFDFNGSRGSFVHPHFGTVLNVKAYGVSNVIQNKKQGFVSFVLNLDANLDSTYTRPALSNRSALTTVSGGLRSIVSDLISGLDSFGNIISETVTNATSIDLLGDLAGDVVNRRVYSAVSELTNFNVGSTLQRFKPFVSPVEKRSWTSTLSRFHNRTSSPTGGYTPRGQRYLSSISQALANEDSELRTIANTRVLVSGLMSNQIEPVASSKGLVDTLEFYATNPLPLDSEIDTTSFHTTALNNNVIFNHMTSIEAMAAIGDALVTTPIRESFSSRDDAVSYLRRVTDASNEVAVIMTNEGAQGGVEAIKEYVTAIQNYEDEFAPALSRIRHAQTRSRNAAVESSRYYNDVNRAAELTMDNNALSIFDLNTNLEIR